MLHGNSSEKLDSAAAAGNNDSDSEEQPFEANLINSTVYIIAMSLQVSTFAINYRVSRPTLSYVLSDRCIVRYR